MSSSIMVSGYSSMPLHPSLFHHHFFPTPSILPRYKKSRLHTFSHSTDENFITLNNHINTNDTPQIQQSKLEPTSPHPKRSYPPRRNSQQRLQDLKEYIDTHGHAHVPYRYPGGLGKWCADQRQRWRKGVLPVKNYHSLISAGFIFDVYQLKWDGQFRQLAAFHSQYGHCSPHGRHGQEWANLKIWVYTQRRLECAGKLEDGRRRRLDGLGFVWRMADESWDSKYQQLSKYKDTFGHCSITTATLLSLNNDSNRGDEEEENTEEEEVGEKYRKLAFWISDQRALWRQGKLSPDREAKLIDLGLEMDPSFKRWQRKLQQLVDAKERGERLTGKQQAWLEKQMELLKEEEEGEMDSRRVQVLRKVQNVLDF